MSLSDKYRYIILCKDKQTQCFMRSFLKGQGISRRKMICIDLPVGGCGEQYVRKCYPDELEKLRATNYNRKVLFVCTDADNKTIEERKYLLEDECNKQKVQHRGNNDFVAFVIPKRNIETWIYFIENIRESIDEFTDYGHFDGNEKEHGKTGEILSKMATEGSLHKSPLLSLQFFQKEYDRLYAMQNIN